MENEDPLHVPGHGHQAPLAANLVEPAQQELSKAQNRFDDAEDRLRGMPAPAVEFFAFGYGPTTSTARSKMSSSFRTRWPRKWPASSSRLCRPPKPRVR